jgi:hypothetical protein
MDLKELKATLKIMRENGVLHLKTNEIELTVSADALFPDKQKASVVSQGEIPSDNPYADFPQGELTQEQLMFYAAGGIPANDPFRKNDDEAV